MRLSGTPAHRSGPATESRTGAPRVGNQLLASLPDEDWAAVQALLTPVPLKRRQVLHRQGEPLRYVYFLNGGIVSMATVLSDGASVEAATIGSEGIVGAGAFFASTSTSSSETIVQVPMAEDGALRMSVTDLRAAFVQSKALHGAVSVYVASLYERITRLTACNVRHDLHQRCARWLLAADDQMNGQTLHLSQEFLAIMLGVRRQAVSGVVNRFRAAGAIQYVRGKITILDRRRLRRVACECYSAMARR